jgi:hypothetical protein
MLAKNPRAPRADRYPALSLTTIVGTPPGACSLLQGIEVHPSKSGRLSGRLRGQASLPLFSSPSDQKLLSGYCASGIMVYHHTHRHFFTLIRSSS